MWRWRSAHGRAQSRFCFAYFHECVEAAQRAGFAVDMQQTLERARQPEIVAVNDYRREPRIADSQ
jgi:hypothetical protein